VLARGARTARGAPFRSPQFPVVDDPAPESEAAASAVYHRRLTVPLAFWNRLYKTLDNIAKDLEVAPSKIRTLIARLDIEPRRFPDDLRVLYNSPADIERIKQILGK